MRNVQLIRRLAVVGVRDNDDVNFHHGGRSAQLSRFCADDVIVRPTPAAVFILTLDTLALRNDV